MSLLDQVIDSAADDKVSTGNLLRQVVTLGSRLKSRELVEWAMKELNGYPKDRLTDLPAYRGPLTVPVEVFAEGWYQSSRKYFITADDVPDERNFRETQFAVWLCEPLAELEQLAVGDSDPSQVWPNSAYRQLVKWAEESRVPHYPDFNISNVRKIIPRTMLHGIIDGVRTRALLFALDIQAQLPDAGELGGPTTESSKVSEIVSYNINNHIYGGTNTVANGADITQNVSIQQGDYEGLAHVLKQLGLGDDERAELKRAMEQDGGQPGTATKDFLERVRAGAIKLGGAVATPVAIDALKMAIAGFMGVPAI